MSIEVAGDREVERKLRDMAARGQHAKPAFVRMLSDLEDIERRFFTERGEGRWPEMSPKTKRRHGEHPLLELRGTLMRSLTEPNAPYAVREAHDDEAYFGTRDPAARLQAGGHGAPRRAVLAPITRSRTRLADLLRQQIVKGDT